MWAKPGCPLNASLEAGTSVFSSDSFGAGGSSDSLDENVRVTVALRLKSFIKLII